MVGTTISHYQILEELGRGGMGVVYRALDERLDRQVAIKVLHSSTVSGKDERARFDREAKAAAGLSHPHIASVHEIDEAVLPGSGDSAVPFIVMEFIEGEALDARIEKGPLPIDEAVQLAIQVASALEAAHEHHIVHRDIKPQNIMLDGSGEAKILDFGLVQTDASTKLTQEGSTLGTVAYMSPEQARGEEVDRRTDLWSLGLTLYEMIAGQHPFPGDYEQARVYSLLNVDPEPLTSLRTGVPMELERIVTKLMAKDRKFRHQTAADLIADLKALQLGGSGPHKTVSLAGIPQHQDDQRTIRISGWMPQVIGVLVILIVGVAGGYWMASTGEPDSKPVIRSTLDVTEGPDPPIALAVSPTATFLAYSDLNQVQVREHSTGESWGYAASGEILRLWFSEDEQWLFMERPGAILRAPSRGGPVTQVVQVEASYPFAFLTDDNDLIYESGGRILKYPMGGGEISDAIRMDSSVFYNDPSITPDGKKYLVSDAGFSRFFDRKTGEPEGELSHLLQLPTFVGEAHLLSGNDDGVFLWPIDVQNQRVTDAPFNVAPASAIRAFSVSREGHLFYADQHVDFEGGFSVQQFGHVSPRGEEMWYAPSAGLYGEFDVDADGEWVSADLLQSAAGIIVANLSSGVSANLFAGSQAKDPIFASKGDSLVVLIHTAGGDTEIRIAASDGSGSSRLAASIAGRVARRPSASPDGTWIVVEVTDPGVARESNIWRIDLRTGETMSLQGGAGNQTHASVSFDGKWLAYASDAERNQSSILIRNLIDGGAGSAITVGLGNRPRWAPDGNALYFIRDGLVHMVDLSRFEIGKTVPESVLEIVPEGRIRAYDVLPEEEGVVVTYSMLVVPLEDREVDGLVHVIYNWASTLDTPTVLEN